MAVNPLVVFVGMSVATLGGLVVVTQQKSSPEPQQVTTTSKVQAEIPPPIVDLSQVPDKKAAPPGKPVKLASLPPKTDTAPVTPQAPTTAKKPKVEKTIPTFDTVRVEEDGGTVVVGKAAPGADVVLKLDGKIFGRTKANDRGDWVFVPEKLIPKGGHALTIEATDKNKKTIGSKDSILVAIPQTPKEKPLVVVSSAKEPTRVLQKPAATKVKKPPVKAPIEKVAIAPVEKPKVLKKAVEPVQLVTGQSVTKTNQQAVSKTMSEPANNQPPVSAPAMKPSAGKLAFGTVDYNDRGDIVFSGKAAPGKTVRLYVDNKFVGDAKADSKGDWVFRGREQIKTGTHELRADQLDDKGKTSQRTAVPFVRANPAKVASLLNARKKTAQKTTQKPAETPVPKPPAGSGQAPEAPVAAPVAQSPVPDSPAPNRNPIKQIAGIPVEKPVVNNAGTTPEKPKAPITTNTQIAKQITEPVQPPVAAKKAERVAHVVIQPGNNLWNISRVIYGKGIAYTTIYQANKSQIKDPDRIYPGQILDTPGTTSSGSIDPARLDPINPPEKQRAEAVTNSSPDDNTGTNN